MVHSDHHGHFVLLDAQTLHDTTSVFVGRTPGAAAKKAATRGLKRILLRKTGTHKVHEYVGNVEYFRTPRQVVAGGRVLTFTKQATAHKVRSFDRRG